MRYRIPMIMALCGWILISLNAIAQSSHTGHDQGTLDKSATKSSAAKMPKSSNEEGRVPIEVPPEQQERIGLKTAKAVKKKIEHTIRTVGVVTADQSKEAHVHSRINGWIEQIFADYVGRAVKKINLFLIFMALSLCQLRKNIWRRALKVP